MVLGPEIPVWFNDHSTNADDQSSISVLFSVPGMVFRYMMIRGLLAFGKYRRSPNSPNAASSHGCGPRYSEGADNGRVTIPIVLSGRIYPVARAIRLVRQPS